MRKLFILLSCLTTIDCADATTIDEASFFDQWWILSETGDAISEYEMTYCFYPDSKRRDHLLGCKLLLP